MSTKTNTKYWVDRKLNWEEAYWSPDHPHRKALIDILKNYQFTSVLEIGCGCGANLGVIKQAFPGVKISGCDISEDAIVAARKKLPEADLRVGNATDLPFNGANFDLVLTDACLIYIGPDKIWRVLREIRRVGDRGGRLVSVEFHSQSFWHRLALRLTSRYYAYDYAKRLGEQFFKGTQIFKIRKKIWGYPWGGKGSYGHIITAIV